MKTKLHLAIFLTLLLAAQPVRAGDVLQLGKYGTQRELFIDSHLIGKLSGDAKQHLHQPNPREVVITTDAPWEGNTCAYYTIFRDRNLFRMYYRGSHWDTNTKKSTHPEVTCYAESKDGIHWTKPKLGLFEFNGSKENNIVWDGIGTHCFVAFKDNNPKCSPEARYKGIARGRPRGKKGLYVFQSPDGIHWKLMHPEPVITEGAFDSQNLAFWDAYTKQYREYHRTFVSGKRSIMTGTSKDFIHWTKPLIWSGSELVMNYSTSAAGTVQAELQDAQGVPLPGFTLDDSELMYGDSLEQPMLWKNNPDLGKWAGTPVRLRFVLKDADLFSLRFR